MSNLLSLSEVVDKYRVRLNDVVGLQEAAAASASSKLKGHFGVVVKAHWKGKQVVVKMSRTKALDERRIREARADLENECRLLG